MGSRGGKKEAGTSRNEPVTKPVQQRRVSTNGKPSSRGASPAGTVTTKPAADNSDPPIDVTEDAQRAKSATADDEDSDVVDPKKSCPCGRSTGEYKLDCSQCQQFWHFGCVGLKGLTKGQSNKLADYKCPFCYVAPVRTTLDTSDCCLSCRNTRVLRDANQTLEGTQLVQNIQSFKALSETLASVDFEALNRNLKAMQDLDTRLLHLLLKGDELEDHQQHLKNVESAVNQISVTLSSPQPSASTTPAALDSIENRLTELQDQVIKLSSRQPLPSSPSATPAVLESIENRLEGLQDQISKLPTHQSVIDQQQKQQQQHPPPEPTVEFTREIITDHGFQYIEGLQEDFIDSTTATQLNTFVEGCEFVMEGGHSVCMYGYPYKYTGSRSTSRVPPIPDAIKGVMEKVNDICTQKGLPLVNSCLINMYEGETGFLPKHSDDEASIHPESSIFTVSLGKECEVIFTDKLNTESEERRVACTDRSMYEMSCKSQGFYTHRIDQGAITDGGRRYSLTLRSLDWKNKHSTCIIGDSNSCMLKFGVNKKTTFGELMPGKQVYKPVLDDIDPTVACAYQNVVVMCGINDVKKPEVDSEGVKSAYIKLKTRIHQIRDLNKGSNIFVCPLLPTKLAGVNRKAMVFNKLIVTDLLSSGLGVTLVRGFDDFLDNSGLLDSRLSKQLDRHRQPDKLHLNWRGAAMLAGMIKSSVFLRINGGVDKRPARRVSGIPYSNIAARGTMAGNRYS